MSPKRFPLVAIGVTLLVSVAIGGWVAWRRHAPAATRQVKSPPTERIKVEVLNATGVRGLARRATEVLRDHGFDVVLMGNSPEAHDSTVVLDRTNHPAWARQVAAALGGARIELRPDSTHYVDITVLLGSRWRPPAQALYP